MGTAWLEHRTDGSLGAGGVHEPPHQAIRILLVEDNPGDARLFYEALKETHSCAFDLVHVERLSSAMDWLTQGRADIILLDLSLPDSHGFETFTKMRACVPGIPLVVLTFSRIIPEIFMGRTTWSKVAWTAAFSCARCAMP